MKQEHLKYISDFISKREIFFEGIYDYATFDKDAFHCFTKAIYNLSLTDLTFEEKHNALVVIWEVAFVIQGYTLAHINPQDFFSFENLSDVDCSKINQILYYGANWFTYNKPIEEDQLNIDSCSWS